MAIIEFVDRDVNAKGAADDARTAAEDLIRGLILADWFTEFPLTIS